MRLPLLLLIYLLGLSPIHARPLIVGTMHYAPPFEIIYKANQKEYFMGFDIDIMNEVCKRINTECQYRSFIYKYLFDAVQTKKVDLAIASITITPERKQVFLFSMPYLQSSAQFLTLSTSPIKEKDGLVNKRIGIQSGTVLITLAKTRFSDAQLLTLDDEKELMQAIITGKVDAVLLDDASASYWVNNNNNLFKLLGKRIPLGLGYGIMSDLKNSALVERIDTALIEMQDDGSYLDIYKKYFN